jgi:hypothetical protein
METSSYKIRVLSGIRQSGRKGDIDYIGIKLISDSNKKERVNVIVFKHRHKTLFDSLKKEIKNWKKFPQTIRNKRLTGSIITIK